MSDVSGKAHYPTQNVLEVEVVSRLLSRKQFLLRIGILFGTGLTQSRMTTLTLTEANEDTSMWAPDWCWPASENKDQAAAFSTWTLHALPTAEKAWGATWFFYREMIIAFGW